MRSHTDVRDAEHVASRLMAIADRGACATEAHVRRRLAGCLLAALVLGAAPTAQASEPDGVAGVLRGEVSEAARRKASLSSAQQKVDSQIRRDAWPEAIPQGRTVAPLAVSRETSWRRAGRARVLVKVTGTASAHTAALGAAGLDIEIVNDRFGLVQGWIADGAVATLAELEIVQSISPAWPAEHSAGTVTSEGDGASRSDLVRQLGHDGAGVVVGVISDGIESLAASQVSGDLPAVTVPPDTRCRRGSGDEGTAMLEIVHDLAPGAGLRFSGISTRLEMIDAIDCLTAGGADVIVDDLIFFGEPFFEDGPIALTAADAVAAGASYHTAAGNFGDREYLVEEYRPGPQDFHDFDPGAGQDILNRVIVPAGGELLCILQWADPFGASGNDYDLIAVEPLTVTILAVSDNVQDGTQDPFEAVAFVNPLSTPLEVGIVIRKFAGLARSLKLLCPDTPLQYRSVHFGISGHAARPEVIAVAAINALDPGLDDAEAFTSRGPAPIFFPSLVARPKPDLAAFDGVTTTAPGFAPFFGTSAAAPHSAAVAALLLSKNPTLSPAQVRTALTSTAVDIEAPGFDNVVGHGRIDALAAINAVGPTTTTITTTSTTTIPTASTTTLPTVSTTTTPTTASTTSTTLPACDPTDCDGNACTVDDACAGGVCQPGSPLTAGRLSDLVRDGANGASAACAGDRRKSVRKVVTPLAQAVRLLGRANTAPSDRKRGKKLAQARRATRQASQKLGKERSRLSPACLARLEATIAGAGGGLSCLP